LVNITTILSEEENKDLANLIVKILGEKPKANEIGADNKMFVDKWTMTPEEWDKYLQTSNYFFIGKSVNGKLDIISYENQGMIKVDRFTPKDHHKIHMFKLGAKYLNTSLFGLVTEKDLLDDYLKTPFEEIPESIKELIKSKAREIKR
jgi:hypothetical protein